MYPRHSLDTYKAMENETTDARYSILDLEMRDCNSTMEGNQVQTARSVEMDTLARF